MTTVAAPVERPDPAPPPNVRRRHRAAIGAQPIDRVNRVVLGMLGLLLIVTGTLGLLAGQDTFSSRSPGAAYGNVARNAVDDPWLWTLGAGALGLALVALGLWWAWKQVAPRAEKGRLSTTVIARTTRGRTTLEPAAVAKAAAADLGQGADICQARVRLVSLDPVPDLIVWLELRVDADTAAVQAALEEPLGRLAHALGAPAVDCDLRLSFGTQHPPRVH